MCEIDSSDGIVLKEQAFPNVIFLCIFTIFHLALIWAPILLFIGGLEEGIIVAVVAAGIFFLFLLATYTICLCYFILTIKYKNIYCGEDEICIRYKNKWIAKMKYNEITEYGELYFHGEYIAAKKSLHYKRGEQEDRVYNFYLNKENRAILRNLIKSKAKYVQKMLC